MLDFIRFAFAAACAACGRTLLLGSDDAFCEGCAPSVTRSGRWRCGADGVPIAGAFGYAGAMAAAIVRTKNGGGRVDLRALQHDLTQLAVHWQGQEPLVALVPVPPQRRRLVQRGMHLPDLIATELAQRGSGRRVVRALDRVDLHAVRREDRSELPQFRVRHAPGRQRDALLIDDVVTTGQTLGLAADTLRQAGWRVRGALCLADARPAVLAELLEAT